MKERIQSSEGADRPGYQKWLQDSEEELTEEEMERKYLIYLKERPANKL